MKMIHHLINKITHPLPPLERGKGYYWTLLLIGIVGALVVGTPFAEGAGLVNGLVMGKVYWFQLAMLFFAVVMGVTVVAGQKVKLVFSWADLGVLLMAGITVATYDRELNPEPMKLLMGGQLVILWFFLRYVFSEYPVLKPYFLFLLMLTGLVEAIWGIEQLHGLRFSNHSLFRLTGSFFNPGPYSGYLAVIVPICISAVLGFKKGVHYFAWICVIAIGIVLPAGMSRSAWLAAIVAGGWVYWMHQFGWKKTKEIGIKYRKTIIPGLLIGGILAGFAATGLYKMKQDSADGRLLMWKVAGKVIAGQPFTGTGLGGFPAAFAEGQAAYFATGQATEQEKLVAGCPEYAFNEYLQIGIEQGLIGLVAFLFWIGSACRMGIRNRQIGAVGGLVALMVFAFSSYPLQLPSFWVVMVVLGAIAGTPDKPGKDDTPPAPSREGKRYSWMIKMGIGVLVVGSVGLFYLQKEGYKTYKQWNRMQMLYNNKAYEAVVDDYKALHPVLGHKPDFLFEEAQCLSKTGQYVEALTVLEQAKRLSGDPMIRYMVAKNLQELKRFGEAEAELLHAIDILPERIYPYYLLTKLYAEPDFDEPDKFMAAADAVLTKEPKVQSTAIQEMRLEVKKILEKK